MPPLRRLILGGGTRPADFCPLAAEPCVLGDPVLFPGPGRLVQSGGQIITDGAHWSVSGEASMDGGTIAGLGTQVVCRAPMSR